jgi:predicted flap endonuclease-1-like 5' DNA nuclease
MNASSDPPTSKGMQLVAAYRAQRLSERKVLRTGLQNSNIALRLARPGGQRSAEPGHQEPAKPSPEEPVVADAAPDSGSVFSNLVSLAAAEQKTEEAKAESVPLEPAASEADVAEEAASSEAQPSEVAVELASPEAQSEKLPEADETNTPPENAPACDPPLAQIGFGPGMLIRLSQLGLHTIADLAQADAEHLRQQLGDISRLVDVEAWISNARRTAGALAEQ